MDVSYSRYLAQHVKAEYVGTAGDVLLPGYCLMQKFDATLDPDKSFQVEKCALDNHSYQAFVCVDYATADANGVCTVAVIPASKDRDVMPGVNLYANQSLTAGDLLGPEPGTFAWRRGGFGHICAKALETVDLSSTAGQALCNVGNVYYTELEKRGSVYQLFDDFYGFSDLAGAWDLNIVNTTPTGTTAVIKSTIGEFEIYSDGDDNDETYVGSTHQFTMSLGFYIKARLKITDRAAQADDGSFVFGLSDISSLENIIVDTAGALHDGDQLAFFKSDGGTVWKAISQTGTTEAADSDIGTRGGNYHTFEIWYDKVGTGSVFFYYDGSLVHTVASTSSGLATGADLRLVYGVKSGTAAVTTAEQAMTVDYVYAVQGT